jgi:DNA-binding MarR family transcriptional regulator
MQRGEKVTCQELANRLQLSLSRCSRIVDRLHSKGFLERIDCPSDRRCKNLSLTAKGIGTKSRIDDLRNECESRLSAVYPEKKLKVLLKELEDLTQRLDMQNNPKISSSR